MQGIKNLTDAEAEAIIAKDRESRTSATCSKRIERGDYPRWLMQVQLMTEEEAAKLQNQSLRPDQSVVSRRFPAASTWAFSN